MKPVLTLLLSALALGPLARAQSGEATVELRVLAFPRVEEERPIEILAGESTLEISPPSNRLSEPVKAPAQATWNVGHQAIDDQGQSRFESLGKGRAGKSPRQILILLRKGPKNEDGFRVLAFDDGPGHFKERQVFFLNLAHEPIAGDVGDVKFALKPAQHTVITPKANQGENLCHASLLRQDGEKWRPFMTSNWPLRDGTRGLILVYNDPATSKIRMHTIRDVP